MDTRQAIITSLTQADIIVNAYLEDLKPQELLARALPGCNHIAWQLGHLIYSEWYLLDKVAPGKMGALPAGFEERHQKNTASRDDASGFLSKEEYVRVARDVRKRTLGVVETLSAADLDRAVTGVPPFVKTAGETLLFIGAHWIMHAGQWAVIRRKLGRPPLF
jgi:hypothetical protein